MRHAVRYCNIATCLVGCERGARCLLDRKFGRAHAEKRPIYATRTNLCAQSTAAMQLHASRESEAPLARREARHAQWQWQRCFRRCNGARLLMLGNAWCACGGGAGPDLGTGPPMGLRSGSRQSLATVEIRPEPCRPYAPQHRQAGRFKPCHATVMLWGEPKSRCRCCRCAHRGGWVGPPRLPRTPGHPPQGATSAPTAGSPCDSGPRLPRPLQFGDSKDRGNQASWRGRS